MADTTTVDSTIEKTYTAEDLLKGLGEIVQESEFHLINLRRFARMTDAQEYRFRAEAIAAQMSVLRDATAKLAQDYATFIVPSGTK